MIAARLAEIAARHDLELILQFGSTVTGHAHAHSDLDVAVLSRGRDLDLKRQVALAAELAELFPDRPLDLAVLDHADPLFLKKVLESCALLHGATRRLHELKMVAFRRYQDHRRYLRMERNFVERFLARGAR